MRSDVRKGDHFAVVYGLIDRVLGYANADRGLCPRTQAAPGR
jgi:hypothetical protein